MNLRVGIEFVLLAALWGSSFLFMRIAVPEFGAFTLAGLRVLIAGLVLLVILSIKKRSVDLRLHWKPIAIVGILNSAVPFLLFAYAMAHISAGLGSILNSTVPLWGAVVAYFWLKDKMSWSRMVGLAMGFSGVVLLSSTALVHSTSMWAVAACLVATLMYGIAASFTKKYMSGIDSLVSATGTQLAAAFALMPMAIWFWPNHGVSLKAWFALIGLALLCTALAYILYFRLFKVLGPSKSITVTFLIPVFGMGWGALLLDEKPTWHMFLACIIIVMGTALTTNLIRFPGRSQTK